MRRWLPGSSAFVETPESAWTFRSTSAAPPSSACVAGAAGDPRRRDGFLCRNRAADRMSRRRYARSPVPAQRTILRWPFPVTAWSATTVPSRATPGALSVSAPCSTGKLSEDLMHVVLNCRNSRSTPAHARSIRTHCAVALAKREHGGRSRAAARRGTSTWITSSWPRWATSPRYLRSGTWSHPVAT